MITFGENILLWRLHRALSQEQLSRLAGIPRPNLSCIERGKREVTLSTIRSLARALDVSAGALVDGVPPKHNDVKQGLSRQAMERIARSVVNGRPPRDPAEKHIYCLLTEVLRCILRSGRSSRLPLPSRKSSRAWLSLRTLYEAATIRSLVQRTLEKAETAWTANR